MISIADLTQNPLRLSYSTLNLLTGCDRKLQLVKLLESNEADKEAPQFSFGHAFGDGVVEYLLTGDMDRALFTAWRAYEPDIEDFRRNVWFAINAVEQAKSTLDELRSEWEVAVFDGKPAAELSFKLIINEWCYFVGYIDAVLRHKRDGHLAVFECKHSTSNLNDLTPMYKNSGQALGYSIVLDRIAEQTLGKYSLFYFVGQLKKPHTPEYHKYEWKKTLLDRLNWFLTLGLDVERLQRNIEIGVFPMRGNHCLSFNRVCDFFGTCNLHSFDKPKVRSPDLIQYQFVYHLDELVKQHLEAVSAQIQRGEATEVEVQQVEVSEEMKELV